MKRRKRNPILPKKTLLIVTASPFASLYFSQVRKDCRYGNMTVEYAPSDDLEGFIKNAAKIRIDGKFDSTWAVFSFDDFNLTVDALKQMMPLAKKKKINLAWNNPCFSLWIYLNLGPLKAFRNDGEFFKQQLSCAIKGYSENEEFLLNKGQNLHLKLYSAFAKAINNLRPYNKLAVEKTGIEASVFNVMYQNIKEICGEADLSHNQKMLSK